MSPVRLASLVALVACGGGGWRPVVVGELADPSAREVKVEFADGQNGTQLVLAVLAQAKAAGVATISDFAIQVGRCTRRIESGTMPVEAAPPSELADLDAITLRAAETRFSCKHVVDQEITNPGGGGDPFGQAQVGDAQMVERTDCKLVPVEHVVTRYRAEVEHRFVPPDWDEVARSGHAQLRFGPPRCGGEAKNEIRARFHANAKAPVDRLRDDGVALPSSTPTPAMIAALVDRAQAAAQAKRPGEATDLAQQALAAIADGRVLAQLPDDTQRIELAGRIAQAHFLAVEVDVDVFLHRGLPSQVDDDWARTVGADIDRIAKRYERIKDLVRLAPVTRWLRAGAGRLAELHLHVAGLLEHAGQTRAAESQREIARTLAAQAR